MPWVGAVGGMVVLGGRAWAWTRSLPLKSVSTGASASRLPPQEASAAQASKACKARSGAREVVFMVWTLDDNRAGAASV